MTRRREVRLDAVPSLTKLYGTGLARTMQAMLVRANITGAVLPDVAYRVDGVRADAERLTAYQHLLGETGSDALPAGFVHVLGFPVAMALMTRTDFPLPLLGLVHLANRVEQRHELTLGGDLTVRAWAERLRAHRSGTQVDLVVEVGLGEGVGVSWRGVSTYLAKGRHLPGLALVETADGAGPAGGDVTERRVPGQADCEFTGSDGTAFAATAQWRLGADVGRRYAAISGDRNPIHLSALTAKAFGFKRAIAHGMYTASRALAAVGPARGDAFGWDVSFDRPALLPGTVAVNIAALPGGGHTYLGWNPRSGKQHFSGSVTPLP